MSFLRTEQMSRTHVDLPQHDSPVFTRCREPFAIVAPLEPPNLVRVILQHMTCRGREGAGVLRIGVRQERERFRGGGRDRVMSLLVGLGLTEQRGQPSLRKHNCRRDVI